jgi:hypothetical protein
MGSGPGSAFPRATFGEIVGQDRVDGIVSRRFPARTVFLSVTAALQDEGCPRAREAPAPAFKNSRLVKPGIVPPPEDRNL